MRLILPVGRYGLLFYLRAAAREGMSGVLEVHTDEDHVDIELCSGEIASARSHAARHQLAAYLLVHRLVTRDALREALSRARQRDVPLEQVLVEEGTLTESALHCAQRDLARYVLAFAHSLAPAQLVVRRTSPKPPPAEPLDAEEAFFVFVATRESPQHLTELLRNAFDAPLTLTREGYSGFLESFARAFADASSGPQALLRRLAEGPVTMSALLADGFDAVELVRQVGALWLAGQVAPVEDAAAAPTPVDARDSAVLADATSAASVRTLHPMSTLRPTGPSPSNPALWVRQTAAELLHKDYYSMLGITPTAPPSAVREACARLRARFAAATQNAELDEASSRARERVMHQIDEARETLTALARREAYDERVLSNASSHRRTTRALFSAEQHLQRARAARDAGEFAQAAELYRLAAQLAPEEAVARAELAWLLLEHPEDTAASTEHAAAEANRLVAEALTIDPRSETVLRIRAQMAYRNGHLREALEAWRRLAGLYPGHVQAAESIAEIERHLQQRHAAHGGSSPSRPAASDIISRLFRRRS